MIHYRRPIGLIQLPFRGVAGILPRHSSALCGANVQLLLATGQVTANGRGPPVALSTGMNRHTLLGLTATLNIAQAWLAQAGPQYRQAANYLNAAVVEIHNAVGWSSQELHEMGEAQNWLVRELTTSAGSRSSSP